MASIVMLAVPAAADYLPSIRIGTAALIDPSNADTQWYKNSTTATDGLKGITGNPTPIPPELIELARSLNSDPGKTVDRVYQYVHNNIQTVWMYGLQKGALGAQIDKSGTPYDQAELMVALLSLNGIQSSYVAGTITLSQAQFEAWTNITKARAACWLLSGGGIPAQVNGTSTVACGNFGANANITSVTMAHIWVKVTISGADYVFDPSYKAYSWRPGIDLYNATGLVAGAPIATATAGMNSGTITSGTHTVPYINTLNDAGLNTSLQGYATSLFSYMNSNGLQGAQIEDIVGGKVMVPDFQSIRQSSLPYQASSALHIWAANPATPEYRVIPNQYRTTLRVRGWMWAYDQNLNHTDKQMFDLTFYVDEIYGRRLTLDTDFNSSITTDADYFPNNVSLDLDGAPLRTYTATFPISGDTARGLPTHLEMWANHPYAAADDGTATIDGTYMDDYVDKQVVLVTPLTIVHGWGDVSPALFTKWSDELASDTPLPRMLHAPKCFNNPEEPCPALYAQAVHARGAAQRGYRKIHRAAAPCHWCRLCRYGAVDARASIPAQSESGRLCTHRQFRPARHRRRFKSGHAEHRLDGQCHAPRSNPLHRRGGRDARRKHERANGGHAGYGIHRHAIFLGQSSADGSCCRPPGAGQFRAAEFPHLHQRQCIGGGQRGAGGWTSDPARSLRYHPSLESAAHRLQLHGLAGIAVHDHPGLCAGEPEFHSDRFTGGVSWAGPARRHHHAALSADRRSAGLLFKRNDKAARRRARGRSL